MSVLKQLQVFMTEHDESEFSELLKRNISGIMFIDDQVWANTPVVREDIVSCQTGRVYLYNRQIEDLPTIRRKDGQIQGPISGCVIQFLRCIIKNGQLRSGTIGVGYNKDDLSMKDFVTRVWRILKSMGKIGVRRMDGIVDKHYLVGKDARDQVLQGDLEIADRSVIGLRYELIE